MRPPVLACALGLALQLLSPGAAGAQERFTLNGAINASDRNGTIDCDELTGETVQFLLTDDQVLQLDEEQVPVLQQCSWVNNGTRLDPDAKAKVLVMVSHAGFQQYHGGEDRPRGVTILPGKTEFQVTLSLRSPDKASDDAYFTARSFVDPRDRIPRRLNGDWPDRIDQAIVWLERSARYRPSVQRVRFLAELQQRIDDFAGCADRFAQAEELANELGNEAKAGSYRYQKLVCMHRLAMDQQATELWLDVRLECNGAIVDGLANLERQRSQVLGICLDALIESSESRSDLGALAETIVDDAAMELSWKALYYYGHLKSQPPGRLETNKVFADLITFSRDLGRTVVLASSSTRGQG